MKNRAYIPAAIFLTIAFILHLSGDVYHVYTLFTWYDDPVHFTSGLGLGFAFYWAFAEFGIFGGLRGRNLWAIVVLTLGAAAIWECFEVVTDTAGYPVGSVAYCVDTVKDIANGVTGSIAALIVIKETFEKGKSGVKKS